MQLSQHTILITGGASGIGWELAKQLQARGNQIIIAGRSANKLQKAKALFPQIHTAVCDVSRPAEIDKLFDEITKEFPKLNLLINNAGVAKVRNLLSEQTDLVELTHEIETNLHGPIRLCQKFLPHLKKQAVAAIVNVSSGLAFVPLPIAPIYCATKAGLHSYTQSLRVQLQKTNIKVFELAPPATQTELMGEFSSEDMKGISVMSAEKMVADALKAIERDQLEICPGQSQQLKFMSRLAPEFILKQLSRPVARMLQV